MDTSSSSVAVKESEIVDAPTTARARKLSASRDEAIGGNKRQKLFDMVFYDGNRHPASVLHELRPEICSNKYEYKLEETDTKRKRFRCSVTIDQNMPEAITVVGIGRSKRLAKNMAAQQALMKLYPTYRPPAEAILTEDSDSTQQNKFTPALPPSLQNDPSSLIESIRKHLTTKAIAIKTPLQLFYEIFVNNQRLNSATSTKNRIEFIENQESLVIVRATAMDRHFWGVSSAKTIAQNEACQQAIETLCNVSFHSAKAEFIDALHSMNKLTLPTRIDADRSQDTFPNSSDSDKMEDQPVTTELMSLPGVSSSFLMPADDA